MMKKSEFAAHDFFNMLCQGKIKKHILPNTAVDYTQVQEALDLERYKFFLYSFAYDDIKNKKVRNYNGN